MLNRKLKKFLAILLVSIMIFTASASAAYAPPISTTPILNQVQSDGTIYSRWYAGYSDTLVDIDFFLVGGGIAAARLVATLGLPGVGADLLAGYALYYARENAIDKGAINFEVHKYIETRQKPGDISPIYTTTYYTRFYYENLSYMDYSFVYTGMSPYTIPADVTAFLTAK